MPIEIHAIGNVQAYVTVAVKSRVDGQVMRVDFKEGQEVTEGQVLFELDPRPFEAQLHQDEANLVRDQAQRDNAQTEERRLHGLLGKHYVTPEQYTQARTNLAMAEATIKADQAKIESDRLNLEYATIRAPITGRTSAVMIQQGNLVKAQDTVAMVTITQMKPIYVSFSVPEQDLPEIRRVMQKGPPTVSVVPSRTHEPPVNGRLSFINNTIDTNTGTVELKATFPNQDEALWPGEFVDATLILGEQQNTVVVPTQAVQAGPNGSYVFVVTPENKVEQRSITTGQTYGDDTVIAQGLNPGERVVTSGQLRLVAGAPVRIVAGEPGP